MLFLQSKMSRFTPININGKIIQGFWKIDGILGILKFNSNNLQTLFS
jgi:hypothetical protein